jgi:hypothetical protein
MTSTFELTHPERDAMLAGLRLLQNQIMDGDITEGIDMIYTNCDAHGGLSVQGIDALSERINI